MKRIIAFLPIVALFTGLLSCEDQLENEDNFKPTDYTVKGKVEKGPFISGSTINLQPMNSKMVPTGSTFSTTITDNAGNFAFNTATLETPFAQLTANGYFFNEVTGRLSNGTLSLRALVDLSEQSTVNVNILTHLKYARILDLVEKDNKNYKEANKQAQRELLSQFGLQKYADTDATNYSITSGTPEAGALIAISALILRNRNEAQVTEYLAKLSQEFGATGTFSVDTKEIIKKDRNALINRISSIEDNIKKRYEELGQTISVMPLECFFDWDDDEEAGNEFVDPNDLPTLSTTAITVPKEGGEYTISIDSKIPLYLDNTGMSQGTPTNSIVLDDFWAYIYKPNTYSPGIIEKTLTSDELKLVVSETRTKKTHVSEITLYDIAGKKAATITVTQEGNPELPVPGLGDDAASVVLGAFAAMEMIMNYMSNEVNAYGNYEGALWTAPIDPNNNDLWHRYYNAINYMNTLKWVDEIHESAFGAYCSLYNAIAYYNMVTLWGGVPYVTEPIIDDSERFSPSRMPENELLDTLQTILEAIIPELDEKKNVFDKDFGFFYGSKDVARILLADIHMYRNQYDKARPYLNDVVETGHYSLASDSDVIMAYMHAIPPRYEQYDTLPLFTYADVLLSLAECDNALGDIEEACNYIKKVAEAKQTFNDVYVIDDIPECISLIRRVSLPDVIGRFAFLKRTGLAKSELNLEDYQLLFPIPTYEIRMNPNLTQNPGY